MRMNNREQTTATASQIINWYSEAQLAQIFHRYGDEPRANSLANLICKNRPLNSTLELARLVAENSPPHGLKKGGNFKHPATKIFQALRIAVNGEFEEIEAGLRAAFEMIRKIILVITFHPLEDKLVKNTLSSMDGLLLPLIQPERQEIEENVRCRSAKLRVFVKNDNKSD